MSLFTKFTSNVANVGYLTERQWMVCLSAKRHCSGSEKSGKDQSGSAFRVLRILPQKGADDKTRGRFTRQTKKIMLEDMQYNESVDWTNVWVGPKSFDPYMFPVPLRQGYVVKGEPPGKYANAELMKIPNFLHLTPPAIKKHCDALKKFCTEWPKELESEKEMEQHFPVTVITSDYCHSSPSIRNPLSRIVTLKINIKALKLDSHAKDKFLRLVGNRYNPKTNTIVLTGQSCPLKKQNYDHIMYILTALCFESWRTEDWEKLKTVDDMVQYCFHKRKSKQNINDYLNYTGKPRPPLDNIASILEKYIGHNKELTMIDKLKEEVIKLLGLPKFG